MKTMIITGGAGFIGSNFIKYILKNNEDFIVVNYDILTYAGNLENLKDIENDPRYFFVKGDISDQIKFSEVLSTYGADFIVNFAAESHVDRSISDPLVFGQTNFLGTLNLLQCAKAFWSKSGYLGKRFLQVSTDEVYGSLNNDYEYFYENSQLMPNSPYSASKAGADLMVRAFYKTHGVPVIITRCSNNYGPYQYNEKFIPVCVSNALNNQPIPIYGDGSNVREWIYVLDHCKAIEKVLFEGTLGEVYNIGSGIELSNNQIAQTILEILDKPQDLIVMVADRLGHDKRYAIDSSKLENELGWSCEHNFENSIKETVIWYKQNQNWWKDK